MPTWSIIVLIHVLLSARLSKTAFLQVLPFTSVMFHLCIFLLVLILHPSLFSPQFAKRNTSNYLYNQQEDSAANELSCPPFVGVGPRRREPRH